MIDVHPAYRIQGPALISFSGGRTSAFMLHQILQAHGGQLPADVRVAFFNTGKEREETLVFVRECGLRWNVPIVWLEYGRLEVEGGGHKPIARVVTFETASRDGEPFEVLIDARSYLPNVVTRFCTTELKIRTGKRWMIQQGYESWLAIIGIRADEAHRAKRVEREPWTRVHPLLDADVDEAQVMAFWREQPFDLGLQQDEGNCDLCFLKGKRKLVELIAQRPDSADWWHQQEKRMADRTPSKAVAFFSNRHSVHQLRVLASQPWLFPTLPDDGVEDCHCTD